MDVKDLRNEATLGELNNDGSKYASGVTLPYSRNKPYQDVNSIPLGKVDASPARPCAVIGPDRVLPPLATSDTIKKSAYDAWCPDNVYRHPPEYPHKMTNYHTPVRNISPRQTFQENMQRIMVPPTYNSLKGNEEHNFPLDKNVAMSKNTKPNIPIETKYCEVPYSGNSTSNEQKSVRNPELSASNVNPVLARSASQGWPHLRPSRPYGASELYQYPEYTNCAGPRPMPMTRPHRTAHDDLSHGYPDPYCHDVRFKPYTTVKERYPQARYEFIGNYSSAYHPPSAFPPHKYDIQKPLPQPYAYPQVPLKYLDSRIADTLVDGYPRPTQQSNYNLPYHNQMIHPAYGQAILGNCVQNKFPCPPEGSIKSVAPNKPPYETNKIYTEYENARHKAFPVSENYYFNEMQRPPPHLKSQVMPNYAVNMQGIPPHTYYRKDSSTLKNYEYLPHFRNIDPSMLPQSRIPTQFSPNGITISPTDTSLTIDNMQMQGNSQEDYGYMSQSPTANIRSMDFAVNRPTNEFYRRYESRYGPIIRPPPMMTKPEQMSNDSSKDKKDIDVRQFLQMWNEVDDENGENATKESVAQFPNGVNKATNQYETAKNQDQLYVLGLVNVPSEELCKYDHIQKVSKLPENIKGYNSIELLNQFEEVIESSNVNNNFKSKSSTKDITYQIPLKNSGSHHSLGLLPRPVSPLDVEAKISQSVIHKEVGCNFEIKPCSPKMLNVEAATPIQNLLGERSIEKVSNPLISTPPLMHGEDKMNCNVLSHQEQQKSPNENIKNTSCKLINNFNNDPVRPNYSLQDLESNSGVCLASLPRLDNDIELNFPEVNQQFINANKGESVITTTKDLPLLSMENTENENATSADDSLLQKPSYQLPSGIDSEREFSKLSKYRKIKKCSSESKEKDILSFSSTQNIRTDSVIIKNPENSKSSEQNKDMLTKESSVNQDKDITHNEKDSGEHDTDEQLSSKLHNDYTQMDIAIDFSLNKNDNSSTMSNPVEYYMENQSMNSPKIDFAKTNNSNNNLPMSHNDCGDLMKEQNEEKQSDSKTLTNVSDLVIKDKRENLNEQSQVNDNCNTIERTNLEIETNSELNELSGFDMHENIEMEEIEVSPSKMYKDNEKADMELLSQEEDKIIKGEEAAKKENSTINICVDDINNVAHDKEPHITKDIVAVHDDVEIKLNVQIEENNCLDLPNLIEENTTAPNSQLHQVSQTGNKEGEYEILSEEGVGDDTDVTNEMDIVQGDFKVTHNIENNNLRENAETHSVSLENQNHENAIEIFEDKENKIEVGQEILKTEDVCGNKVNFQSCENNNIVISKENLTPPLDNDTMIKVLDDKNLNVDEAKQSEMLYRDGECSSTLSLVGESPLGNKTNITLPNQNNQCVKLQSSLENINKSEILEYSNQLSISAENLTNNPIISVEDSYESTCSRLDVSNHETNNVDIYDSNKSSTYNILTNNLIDTNKSVELSITTEKQCDDDFSIITSDELHTPKVTFKSCLLKKELFSPFIRKLVSHSEGAVQPHPMKLTDNVQANPISPHSSHNSEEIVELERKKNDNDTDDTQCPGTSNEETLYENSTTKNVKTILPAISENKNMHIVDESIAEMTTAINLENHGRDDIQTSISSPEDKISTLEKHINLSTEINSENTTLSHEQECIETSYTDTDTSLARSPGYTNNWIPLPSVDQKSNENITTFTESGIHLSNDYIGDSENKANDTNNELTVKEAPANVEVITCNDFNIECTLNLNTQQDPVDDYLFQNKQLTRDPDRTSLKRSLSDSALDSFNDSCDAFYSGWRPKRAKKKFCNIVEPDIIFDPNNQNNRRKSISSIYNEQNVSLCILIDDNCIITEEEESEEQDAICFTEISESCLTDLQESINEYDNIETPPECSEGCNQEYSETQETDGAWVNDVGCMETLVSDDVAEDITISASSSPDRFDSPENEESEIFLTSEHTDKVKHIYGDKMCNDDVMFLETLYRTPQMNVNKMINRESQISEECIQYYNKDSLEKVLTESSSHEDLRSDLEPIAVTSKPHISFDTEQIKNVLSDINLDTENVSPTEQLISLCNNGSKNESNELHNNKDILSVPDKTQDDTIHSCESSLDNVFSYSQRDEYATYTSSTSPEVSSTTSEERNSSILLKITNYNGSRISQINDVEQETKSISCKFTELNDYSSTQNFKSNRPLITKAAQKYIPPLEESLDDLKIRLPLPQHSLLRLKQLKLLKEEPKLNKCNTKSKPDIPKKPKPKFEDVLKSIDEIQFKMHKDKSKKSKKSIPKVVIKKNENGSHYASTTNREPFNPDLTGRKWQPWVFLEKCHFIDKMATKNKKKAIFNHRKNTYVLAEKFRKYKSIGNAKFVISQPNSHNSSIGHLKCTIRLKHTY